MAEPFLAEIRMMSFGFPPKGWALCNGQRLPVNQNQALFSLLGTTYGGDGRQTFQLPDFQGRVPIHVGPSYPLGAVGGEAKHTLTVNELPAHNHVVNASSTAAETNIPGNTAYLGLVNNTYGPATNLVAMAPSEIGTAGGQQPHENMQPYLGITFSIALQGIFPTRN